MAGSESSLTSKYRGSLKHKSRPAQGRKGTICPEWTHIGLGVDPFNHEWNQTQAHALFEQAEQSANEPGPVFATKNGIAFEGKPTADGTWHGYPVPWEQVPHDLKDKWLASGKVRKKDLRRYLSRPVSDVRWAMNVDDN